MITLKESVSHSQPGLSSSVLWDSEFRCQRRSIYSGFLLRGANKLHPYGAETDKTNVDSLKRKQTDSTVLSDSNILDISARHYLTVCSVTFKG